MTEYRPRLTVDLESPEMFNRLRNLLPHGTQRIVFNIIIKDLIRLLETFGVNKVLAAFLEKDIDLVTLCRLDPKYGNNPLVKQVPARNGSRLRPLPNYGDEAPPQGECHLEAQDGDEDEA